MQGIHFWIELLALALTPAAAGGEEGKIAKEFMPRMNFSAGHTNCNTNDNSR